MLAALLPFLLLFTLYGTREASADGTLLQVDDETLDELQAEERRAAADVMKRVAGIRQQHSVQSDSKFSKMKELFSKATAILPGDFKADVAFAGQCVTKSAPETFGPALANLYVERDPLLGTQIYLAPKVDDPKATDPNYLTLDTEQMKRIHQQRRAEKDRFTALQFGLAKGTPLSDLLSAMNHNSVFFTYRPPSRGLASRSKTQGGGIQTTVLFNVRMDRAPSGKPFVIVERLCPNLQGCKIQGDSIVDYLNYVEPFGYCYYTRMHYLPR